MTNGKIIAAGRPQELIDTYGSPKKMVTVSDSLEDIFVKLVGAKMEEAGDMKES